MKCTICSHEIPEGMKCCPKCGRVLTAADLQREKARRQQQGAKDASAVYKPASSKPSDAPQTTIHIPDIFSSDPDTPEYTDPHAYDKATADILAYDRMFITGEDSPNDYHDESNNESFFGEYDTQPENEDNYGEYDEEYEDEPQRGAVIRDKKNSKPRLKFNGKIFAVFICVIIGLIIIVAGIHQIGKQFGLWGAQETTAPISNSAEPASKASPETESAQTVPSSLPTGKYTVSSEQKNIFMYKTSKADRIFATVPNGTVINVTEIVNNMGKTAYNSYEGWVSMDDLKYSPDAYLEETTTAPADSDSDIPASPGDYTVDLKGDGDSVNVRDDHSTNGTVLTVLPEGTKVTVEEVQSGWGKVNIDGTEGWIYMKYLK